MKRLSGLAAATAALMLMSYSSYAPAQTAPTTGTDTIAPAANTAPPAATTAPPAATTPAATQPDANPPTTEKAAPKKKKTAAKKRTRQQEIEHSIDTGTVPARYRSSVPKQYRQYIPFAKQ
ncbi:hypothetical protein [Bradyrhizobium cenepequi]